MQHLWTGKKVIDGNLLIEGDTNETVARPDDAALDVDVLDKRNADGRPDIEFLIGEQADAAFRDVSNNGEVFRIAKLQLGDAEHRHRPPRLTPVGRGRQAKIFRDGR